MKALQLTLTVRDLRTNARVEMSFRHSPVIVGRDAHNGVRLDASVVSRRHGEFRFGKRGLHYVDLGSTNGSYVDASPVELNAEIPVRESSVIDVIPFQIVARVDLVSGSEQLVEASSKTPTNRTGRAPAPAGEWSTELARSASMQRLFLEHGPVALYRRATLALEVLAGVISREASGRALPSSPLQSFASTAELVAHLIDPAAGARPLDDLRDALGVLLQSGANISREGTS